MTPERWHQITEVFQAALERDDSLRSAFVEEACAGDRDLRAEVDAMLAAHSGAGHFGERPVSVHPVETSRLAAGAIIGPYRVEQFIGAGGMGEVYRARDEQLQRNVAIKFLQRNHASDDRAHPRLLREARAAAALNHPGICTIHEVGEADGRPYLAMELIDGVPLRSLIHDGLPLEKILSYGRQLTEAVAHAHRRGVVHGDLKTANAIVTPEGVVKVLDFGLATRIKPDLAANTALSSDASFLRPGVLAGTLAYLAPERLRGEPANVRSDVWALGIMLHEMAAGRPPFEAKTALALVAAIVDEPPTPLPPTVPRALQTVIARCLEKRAVRRYADAGGVRAALDDVIAGGMDPRPAQRAGLSMPRWAAVVGLGIAIALTAATLTRNEPEPTGLQLTRPKQIAASVGIEVQPSLSPDGSIVAYQSDQAGNTDIWITQGGGAAANRTADSQVGDEVPRLSPDGKQIAFWSARDGGGIFLMPALAGAARKIAPARPDVPAAAAWSPDGSELAYPVSEQGQTSIEFLNLQHGSTRRIAATQCLDLTWSPDGRFLAYINANSYNNQVTRLVMLRLSDGNRVRLTDNRHVHWSPAWSADSRTIYFTSNRGGTMDLWRQAITDESEALGTPERVTTALDVLQATFTADEKRVAYAKGRSVAHVWRVPVLADRPVTWADAQQVTFDQAHIESFDLSPDGRRLAVQSDRSGNPDIWIMPADGGEMQQLTTDPTPDWWPAWSPDGREIAFYAFRTGARATWVQSVAGGSARQITQLQTSFPRWSPDGKSLFVMFQGVSVVVATGGEPRPILDAVARQMWEGSSGNFTVSPDGRWLAFGGGPAGNRRIWRVRAAGGDAAPLTQGQGNAPSWSPDGKWVYFTSIRGAGSFQLERTGVNVWRVGIDGKPERPVTNLTGRRGFLGPNVATDGHWLYFTWREDVADIWMMDVEREGK